jgi:hypothetical protein
MLGYDSGSNLGKVPGSDSGKESSTISVKNLGNTLRCNSGSDSGKVLGSDSGKESGIILGKRPGKKSVRSYTTG